MIEHGSTETYKRTDAKVIWIRTDAKVIINYAVSYLSNLIVVELNISALFVFLQSLILT
jgi:hypothetical protein